MTETSVFLGKSDKREVLSLKHANRHGLISGATGTGKTVTLQIIAEGFSAAGVPVFVADVKGDLSGVAEPVEMKDFLTARAQTVGLDPYEPKGFPVCFWDLFGEQGHPVRATVSEMGPLLLSRLLDLNDTQEGVLTLAFRLADDEGLLLLDLKDLRALLVTVADRSKELSAEYGHVSRASVGAIQRRLLALEEQGAERFFGEPALELKDFLRTTEDGAGIINILAADKLMQTPKLYATFLLWLLSELFEELPEIGDPDKPKLVFFFDEAHLLFDEAPKALLEKVEQVVRLIRSKGVGVFFVTQNPLDVPDSVSSQLGNRVQHALRAFTPREQRVVKAAADTFRPNPAFDTLEVITQLGIGEALVSTLESKGAPSVVQRTLIRPPSSRMGPLTITERKNVLRYSDMADKYDDEVDRESAYEILKERAEKLAEQEAKAREKEEKQKSSKRTRSRRRRSNRQSVGEAAFKTAARTLARELVRGLLGSLKRR
ncbi:helicase HerA-like domain-containing protein [Hyphococcus sp.]|uniref:helicase HerA-like domain-containing protein n=1 Tax=Hyphococcus sp. TaxID=2038636 RepID=UPI0035C69D1E